MPVPPFGGLYNIELLCLNVAVTAYKLIFPNIKRVFFSVKASDGFAAIS